MAHPSVDAIVATVEAGVKALVERAAKAEADFVSIEADLEQLTARVEAIFAPEVDPVTQAPA
jgi:hypothetical protein